MKRYLYSFLFILITISSFGQAQNAYDSNGKKNGVWIVRHSNSTVKKYVGKFEHGAPIGRFVFYYENGDKKSETIYSSATSAYTQMFHTNGKVMAEGKYLDKLKDSVWVSYDNRGYISTKEFFVKNRLQGERLVFYVKGKVYESTQFENGVKHGAWKQFYDNGKVKVEGKYRRGNLNGRVIHYHSNGNKFMVGYYKYAVQNGGWVVYDKNGIITRKNYYKNGKLLKGPALEAYLKENNIKE